MLLLNQGLMPSAMGHGFIAMSALVLVIQASIHTELHTEISDMDDMPCR